MSFDFLITFQQVALVGGLLVAAGAVLFFARRRGCGLALLAVGLTFLLGAAAMVAAAP